MSFPTIHRSIEEVSKITEQNNVVIPTEVCSFFKLKHFTDVLQLQPQVKLNVKYGNEEEETN